MGLEERGWGRVPEGRTLRVTPPSFGNPQKANEGSPLLQTFTSAQHTRGGVGVVESYVNYYYWYGLVAEYCVVVGCFLLNVLVCEPCD